MKKNKEERYTYFRKKEYLEQEIQEEKWKWGKKSERKRNAHRFE